MSAILFGLVALGYIWLAVQANNKFERQLRRARLSKSTFKRPWWLFKDAVFILMVGLSFMVRNIHFYVLISHVPTLTSIPCICKKPWPLCNT